MQLSLGVTTVDFDACEVIRDGQHSPLTATEVALLAYLVQHAGRTLTRAELLVDVLGYAPSVESRAVDHALGRLRKKVEVDPTNPKYLRAVRGIGYRLDLPEDPDFIGRATDLATLQGQLTPGITVLVGPGGVGKTRLARAAFGRWSGSGIFVDLAAATQVSDLLVVVAGGLGVPLSAGSESLQQQRLGAVLASRGSLLLVLDNLEQLGDACVSTISAWLADAADLVVLATSRRDLGATNETIQQLKPLSVADAVALYEFRAQARRPDFLLSDADRRHVQAFVEAVDGLPLAIELAASRIGVLSPADLLQRAAGRLSLRGDPTTHAATSLQECISWSWELLGPSQRAGWIAAAAFEDGFTLSDWEYVADLKDSLDVLDDLISHQLIVSETHTDGTRRHRLLVTLHSFARAQLAASASRADIERRHWRRMASQARQCMRMTEASGDHSWQERQRQNLMVAFERSLSIEPIEALDCLRALEVVFNNHGPAALRLQLVRRAMEAIEHTDMVEQIAHLHQRLGVAYIANGDTERGLANANQAHDMLDQLSQPQDRARILLGYAGVLLHTNHIAQAEEAYVRCAAQAARADDAFLLGLAHYNRGYALHLLDRNQEALESAHLAAAHMQSLDAHTNEGAAYSLIAAVHLHLGDVPAARLALAHADRVIVNRQGLIWLDIRCTQAHLELADGNATEALDHFESAAEVAYAVGFDDLLADIRSGRALALADLGQWEQADGAFFEARAHHQRRAHTGPAALALAMSGAVQWIRGERARGIKRLRAAHAEVKDTGGLNRYPVSCLFTIGLSATAPAQAVAVADELRVASAGGSDVPLALSEIADVALQRAGVVTNAADLSRALGFQASSPDVRLALAMLRHGYDDERGQ